MHTHVSTTFDQHLAVMTAESPCALVLDWWRRLDRSLVEYADALRAPRPAHGRQRFERLLDCDPLLGRGVGSRVRELREFRNQVAHHDRLHISDVQAQVYARACFSLIGVIGWRLPRTEWGAA